MNIQHVSIKFYAPKDAKIQLEDMIPIFHRWIQEKEWKEELLIDVADYSHVPAGPGVILVGHEAFYSIEYGSEECLGLLYNRKKEIKTQNNQETFIKAIEASLRAKERLAKDNVIFSTDKMSIRINDRYLAPNEEQTFINLKDDIQASLKRCFPNKSYNIFYDQKDPRSLFEVWASLS